MKNNTEAQQKTTTIEISQEQILVRPMMLEDIPTIVAIEEVSFPSPWKAESFAGELKDNKIARYFCLEAKGKVVGYMGVWLIVGEAHVTNVAIWPGCRGKGLGEYLLRHVMTEVRNYGITRMTLEVRVSNTHAQKLYGKLGFTTAGVRKKYYSDNQEDALIMWANL